MTSGLQLTVSSPSGLLSREVRRIVQLPSMKQQFKRRSPLARDLEAAGLNRFFGDEPPFWVPLAKDVGLKVE